MAVLREGRDRSQDYGDFELMTVEEIKASVSMRDVLEKYGVSVGRNGMCKCPIHGEAHPSMKVFPDGYKCFACNSGGDIFKFVQEMEKCDFKTAFKLLGGSYAHQTGRAARMAQRAHFDREKAKKELARKNEREFRRILMGCIDLCNWYLSNREPLSDDWCYARNAIQWFYHVYDIKYIEGEEVNEVDVFRKYQQVRQRFIT